MRTLPYFLAHVMLLPAAVLAQSLVPTRADEMGTAGPEAARSCSPGTWWKWNRAEFLPLQVASPIAEPDARIALATVMAHLVHEHPLVRAAAYRALGRAGRRFADISVVPALTRGLDDASADLRFDAIHALGLSAQPAAITELLEITSRETRRKPSRFAADDRCRAAAVLALALARTPQNAARIDPAIAALAECRELDAEVELACSMFKRFADLRVVDAPPAAEVSTSAFDVIAADSRSADVQRRRAAAMSLGERGDLRASAYLQSWFPAEREHLTRAFVLIALGRCSDAEARVFLHRAWRSSSTSLRPWCAIALAIRARMQGDEEIRAELRHAAVRERNQIAARATLLACGIAGDEEARPMALLALRTGKNTGIRVAAARTLAMLGGEQACTALTQAIAAETCPTTRAILADALGELGRVEDAPLLIQYLLRYSELAQRRTIARAIARLGPAALEKLMQELARDHIPAAGRASLIDALGWFLAGDQQPPALAILLQSANYMTTPTWMESALTRIE